MIKHWAIIFLLLAPFLGMAQMKCGQVEYGSPQAPLKIIEYASPSCTICSEFSKLIFPKIETYIQGEKIKLTVVNLPYTAIDLKVCALIKHSPDPGRFSTFIYQHQGEWLFSKDPLKKLISLLEKKGMSRDQIKKALRNKKFEESLLKERITKEQKFNITAIPMLVIGQKKIIGLMPWNKLKLVIEDGLQHIKKGNPLETFGQTDENKESTRKTPSFKKRNSIKG